MKRQIWTGLASVLGIALAARTSMAQEIGVAYESSLPRVDVHGNQLQKRNPALTPEAVSHQDCADDQRIRFTLLSSGYAANASIEAWATNAGEDCASATNRASTTQRCWKVFDSAIPLEPQTNVDIPVRRIMSGTTPFYPAATDATSNVCGKVDLALISVQFLYFAPGNLSQAAVQHTVQVAVDTVGPPAVRGLEVRGGAGKLHATFDALDPLVARGANAYCAVAADADALGAALRLCGSVTGANATSVDVTSLDGQPLQPGTMYTVAVAATDAYGNVGASSPMRSASPTSAGGADEGGCATSGASPLGTVVAALVVGLAVATRRRRRH